MTSNSEFRMRLSSCLKRLESCLRRKSASISCLVLGMRMRTQQHKMITVAGTNRVNRKSYRIFLQIWDVKYRRLKEQLRLEREPAKSGILQQ
jgi:hypothetical protein